MSHISSGHSLSHYPANDASSSCNVLHACIGLLSASEARGGVWECLWMSPSDPVQIAFCGLLPSRLG